MPVDFVASSDGTKLPTRTRTDGAPASGTVEVPEGVTDFLDGSGNPVPVSATAPMPITAGTGVTIPVSAASLPLPSDAATQTTLAALNAKVTAVNTGAVTVSSSALPTGAATETTLASLNGKVTAVNTGAVVLAAGAAIAGRFGIDQTTPGTTNLVSVAGPSNAVASLTNPVPTTMAALYYPASTGNNTTAQLASGATFTGAWESIVNQQAAQVTVVCDQPYTLIIEQAQDAGGTKKITTDANYTFTRLAGFPTCENIMLPGNYFRLKVTNTGGSTTTTLAVDVTFGVMPTHPYSLSNLGNQKSAVNEVSGAALTLGQKAMAASLPVTIASDQPAIAVTGSFSASAPDNVVISASTISAVGDTAWFSTTGYQTIAIALTGNWAGSVQINGSHDQVRPDALLVQETNGAYVQDEINGPGLYFIRSITPFIQISTAQLVGTITYSIVGKAGQGPDSLSLLSQALDPASTVNMNVNVAGGLAKDASNALILSDCKTLTYNVGVNSTVVFDTIGYQSFTVQSVGGNASFNLACSADGVNFSGSPTGVQIGQSGTVQAINANSLTAWPVIARYYRITASLAGTWIVTLRLAPFSPGAGQASPINLLQIGSQSAATTGVNGALVVGGNVAVGSPQTQFPLVIGGIDSNALTRRLLTDTTGRLATTSTAQLLPSQSLQNVAPLNVLDTSNHEKIPNSELLWQILTELKIVSYYLSAMPAMLNRPEGQYGFPGSEEPAALRNQPQDLDHPVSN